MSTPRRIFWAKAEVARVELPITVDVSATGGPATRVLFIAGSGWLQDYVAERLPEVLPSAASPGRLTAGVIQTLLSFDGRPPAKFQLLALSGSDVTAGPTGVWSPDPAILPFLPTSLTSVFAAGRSGSVPVAVRNDPDAA